MERERKRGRARWWRLLMGRGDVFTLLSKDIHITFKASERAALPPIPPCTITVKAYACSCAHMYAYTLTHSLKHWRVHTHSDAHDKTSHWQVSGFTWHPSVNTLFHRDNDHQESRGGQGTDFGIVESKKIRLLITQDKLVKSHWIN